MVDFSNVSKVATILVRRLELSRVEAEKAAANFDEHDLAKLVELDETAAAASMHPRDRPDADAAAKRKVQDLVDSIQQRIDAAQKRTVAEKVSPLLRKHLGVSTEDADKSAAMFDEYTLGRLVKIDKKVESAPSDRQAAEKAEAKKRIQSLINAAKELNSVA